MYDPSHVFFLLRNSHITIYCELRKFVKMAPFDKEFPYEKRTKNGGVSGNFCQILNENPCWKGKMAKDVRFSHYVNEKNRIRV